VGQPVVPLPPHHSTCGEWRSSYHGAARPTRGGTVAHTTASIARWLQRSQGRQAGTWCIGLRQAPMAEAAADSLRPTRNVWIKRERALGCRHDRRPAAMATEPFLEIRTAAEAITIDTMDDRR